MQYHAWRTVTFLVRRLPLRVSYAIATVAGIAGFYLWPRGRRAMMRNYRQVLDPSLVGKRRTIARASLVNYCRYLVDFIRFPALDADAVRCQVDWNGALDGLDRALERGRGAVIVSMHFGNWDAGAGAAAAAGYPLTVIAETFADPRLDAMVVGARERLGMRVVKMERAAPSLFRALKQNGLLAVLIDRPVPGEGVSVPFFGREVEVPAGPARLALRSGAAVVPAAFARVRPGSPDVVALTDFTIDYIPTGNDEVDIPCLTRAILTAQEQFIRRYPDQWYMFREMWRDREVGER